MKAQNDTLKTVRNQVSKMVLVGSATIFSFKICFFVFEFLFSISKTLDFRFRYKSYSTFLKILPFVALLFVLQIYVF